MLTPKHHYYFCAKYDQGRLGGGGGGGGDVCAQILGTLTVIGMTTLCFGSSMERAMFGAMYSFLPLPPPSVHV